MGSKVPSNPNQAARFHTPVIPGLPWSKEPRRNSPQQPGNPRTEHYLQSRKEGARKEDETRVGLLCWRGSLCSWAAFPSGSSRRPSSLPLPALQARAALPMMLQQEHTALPGLAAAHGHFPRRCGISLEQEARLEQPLGPAPLCH